MFMPDPEDKNAAESEEVLELIQFSSEKLLERRKTTVNEIVRSWEDDYILLYRRETTPNNTSPFQTENIISKRGFYMKMIGELGLSDFPVDFMG
jgi:hypothetical protein